MLSTGGLNVKPAVELSERGAARHRLDTLAKDQPINSCPRVSGRWQVADWIETVVPIV